MSVGRVAIQVFWLPASFEDVKRRFRLCYQRNIAENQPANSQEPPAQPLQQGPQMAGHRNFDNTARPPEKQGRLVPRWSGRHRRRHRLHPHRRSRRHHCGRQWPQPLLLQHPVNRLSITSAHRKGPCARLNGADTSTPVFALTGQTLANRVHAAASAAGLGEGLSGHSRRIGMARSLGKKVCRGPAQVATMVQPVSKPSGRHYGNFLAREEQDCLQPRQRVRLLQNHEYLVN
jgi:hypothetical protein